MVSPAKCRPKSTACMAILHLTLTMSLLCGACVGDYPTRAAVSDNQNNAGSAQCVTPEAERCDGIDNDCDGDIDEDFPRRGVACGENRGLCAAEYVCEGGEEVCFSSVLPAEEVCDGLDNDCDGSIDELTQDDPAHCGSCGQRCRFPQGVSECVAGICVLLACEDGFADCDANPVTGCETDVTSTVDHCGWCGLTCSFAGTSSRCEAGQCVIESCELPLQNCNGVATDGCESNIETDPDNCQGCGVVCAAPNAVGACTIDGCGIEGCEDGYVDYDGDPANGCEYGLPILAGPLAGAIDAIAVDGSILWTVEGTTLHRYLLDAEGNVGAPEHETVLSGTVRAMAASANGVYLAMTEGDVQVVSTTQEGLVRGALIATTGGNPGVAAYDRWLFVVDGRDGLRIVDTSDPYAPRVVAHVTIPHPVNAVHLAGDLALLYQSGARNLSTVDVSEPRVPADTRTYQTDIDIDALTLDGNLLSVAARGSSTLHTYRLHTEGLTHLGSVSGPTAVALAYRYPFLVVIGGQETVQVDALDIRRPQQPAMVATYPTPSPNSPRSVQFAGDHVYIGGSAGLQHLDIADPRRPRLEQNLVTTTDLRDVSVQGDIMAVSTDGSVAIWDISAPDAAVQINTVGESARRVKVTQGTVYIAADEPAIAGYRLSALRTPAPEPFLVLAGERPRDFEVSGVEDYLYGLYGNSMLRSFELVDSTGEQRSNIALNDRCHRLTRHPYQPVLYLACDGGVVIVEATDGNLSVRARPGVGSLYDLQVFPLTPEWSMMYAARDEGLAVFNLFSPTSVEEVTSVSLGGGMRRVTVDPDWIVIGGGAQATVLPRRLDTPEGVSIPARTFPANVVAVGTASDTFYVGTRTGVYRLGIEGGP